jgi:hypothetical protein
MKEASEIAAYVSIVVLSIAILATKMQDALTPYIAVTKMSNKHLKQRQRFFGSS